MTSPSKPNAVANADPTKSPEKRAKPPKLSRYSSDTDFHDLIANIDAGDMCENLELLQLHDDDDEKMQRSSFSEDNKPRLHRQSSNWSFSLGSFDGSYSEDVSAAFEEEYSVGTTSRDDVDTSHLSSHFFSVVNIPKQTNLNSSQHNTTLSSIQSKYQSSLHDVDSEAEEAEQQLYEVSIKE